MAFAPKPVILTSVDSEDYESSLAPQELLVVGGVNSAIEPQPAIANITTADGSDAETTQALANATKAKVNQILVALRNAGIISA